MTPIQTGASSAPGHPVRRRPRVEFVPFDGGRFTLLHSRKSTLIVLDRSLLDAIATEAGHSGSLRVGPFLKYLPRMPSAAAVRSAFRTFKRAAAAEVATSCDDERLAHGFYAAAPWLLAAGCKEFGAHALSAALLSLPQSGRAAGPAAPQAAPQAAPEAAPQAAEDRTSEDGSRSRLDGRRLDGSLSEGSLSEGSRLDRNRSRSRLDRSHWHSSRSLMDGSLMDGSGIRDGVARLVSNSLGRLPPLPEDEPEQEGGRDGSGLDALLGDDADDDALGSGGDLGDSGGSGGGSGARAGGPLGGAAADGSAGAPRGEAGADGTDYTVPPTQLSEAQKQMPYRIDEKDMEEALLKDIDDFGDWSLNGVQMDPVRPSR